MGAGLRRSIERGVATFARSANGGMILTAGNWGIEHRDLIIELAARHRLPAVYPYRLHVTAGGLTESSRRTHLPLMPYFEQGKSGGVAARRATVSMSAACQRLEPSGAERPHPIKISTKISIVRPGTKLCSSRALFYSKDGELPSASR
jgi:hypothetical protein